MAYRVTVTNTGSRAGAYSALAFHSPPNASAAAHDTADYMSVAPFKQLFDFGRVFLQPGEAKTIDFLLELGVSDLPCNVRRQGRAIPCNWRVLPCNIRRKGV